MGILRWKDALEHQDIHMLAHAEISPTPPPRLLAKLLCGHFQILATGSFAREFVTWLDVS